MFMIYPHKPQTKPQFKFFDHLENEHIIIDLKHRRLLFFYAADSIDNFLHFFDSLV